MNWKETQSLAELEKTMKVSTELFERIHLNVQKLDSENQARLYSMLSNSDGIIPSKYAEQISKTAKPTDETLTLRRSRRIKDVTSFSSIKVNRSKFLDKYENMRLPGTSDSVTDNLSELLAAQKELKEIANRSNQLLKNALIRFKKNNPEVSDFISKVKVDSHLDDGEPECPIKNIKISQKIFDSNIALLLENTDGICPGLGQAML